MDAPNIGLCLMISFSKKKKNGHVVVIGNEKGGSGKSTVAMHVVVGLIQQGHSVATIDLDFRQGTLSRYVANREIFVSRTSREIKKPSHYRFEVNSIERPSEKEIGINPRSRSARLRWAVRTDAPAWGQEAVA